MADRPNVIYALIDPRTDEVRYVGKTNQPLGYRLAGHLREKLKCHRCHWIAQLVSLGMKPKIMALETCGRWPWQETERFWIRSFWLAGARLTNNTSGGDGVPDLPPETRDRMRKVWLGRKHSKDTIQKLKTCRPDFKHSERTKREMSKTRKGRLITWTDKIAESNRKLTPQQVESIKTRLASGELGIVLAKEFQVHRTTMSKIKMGTYFDRYRRSKS
jgi:hypothetical protein